jgi:hypothetical protein
MRIRSLRIRNFRAIELFEVDGLTDFILIAGPNGCGKTTVLDALRLLKSLYVREEWKRWFSEFGIEVERATNLGTLFQDSSAPAIIEAAFMLSDIERAFLLERAYHIALGLTLNNMTDRQITVTGDPPLMPPALSQERTEQIESEATQVANEIKTALEQNEGFTASARLTFPPHLEVTHSPLAVAAFSCFNPDALGEIEFHGSRRFYMRESVTNIRLRIGDRSEERRSRFLYDLENKYRNVKTQLGEEYVAATLRREDPNEAPLQKSIKELFRTFFPGKEFLGVSLAPDNSLTFPVLLSTGERHDIDELSSGEKEIVYGYLWLRTGTPRGSVVLVDEPELHLNPALVQGLPAFYQEHLADALDAQVWVVTHSDAILRQAVRARDMAVYHMARPLGDGSNQAIHIDNQDAVEAAVIDLVGDLAAYRPYAKIVLVEGHKETRFDVDMIRRLFPDFAERGNFIPVGNRRMTTGIQIRLLEVLQESGLAGRAVSISDGDLGLQQESMQAGQFVWPVYEIENFLLEPIVLRGAAELLLRNDPFDSERAVVDELRALAGQLVDSLALVEVQYLLNQEFMKSLSIGAAQSAPVNGLVRSAASSRDAILELDISEERINQLFNEASDRLRHYIDSNEFLVRFPGDRLLRALAGRLGISGEHYRNACLDQAQRLGLRPSAMQDTLRDALS